MNHYKYYHQHQLKTSIVSRTLTHTHGKSKMNTKIKNSTYIIIFPEQQKMALIPKDKNRWTCHSVDEYLTLCSVSSLFWFRSNSAFFFSIFASRFASSDAMFSIACWVFFISDFTHHTHCSLYQSSYKHMFDTASPKIKISVSSRNVHPRLLENIFKECSYHICHLVQPYLSWPNFVLTERLCASNYHKHGYSSQRSICLLPVSTDQIAILPLLRKSVMSLCQLQYTDSWLSVWGEVQICIRLSWYTATHRLLLQ